MVSFVKLQICINMTIFYRLSQKVALMLFGIGCNIAFLGHPCVCIAITPFIFRWQCQLILTVGTKSFGTRYCPVSEEACLTERAKCIQDVRAAGGGTGDKPKLILHLLADPSRYFYQGFSLQVMLTWLKLYYL